MTVQSIGLLFNTQKRVAIEVAQRVLTWGRERGVPILLPPHEATVLGAPETSDEAWRQMGFPGGE